MQLEIAEAALDEAQAARDHYASIRPELGDDFAAELSHALWWVTSYPLAWARIGHNARRRLLTRFPYGVVYRVEPNLIRVVAVMHQRQRPGYWRGR